MTLIAAFLAAHLGGVLTVLGGLGAIVGAWWHGKSTGTKQATQAAAGQIAQAQAAAQAAQSQTADAQAAAAAMQSGADAAAARASIDNDVSAKPAQEVRDELANDWTRR
ncbi:hypothetical protein DX980_07265 [Burkholderia gladioli]|uniref:hypothetical protein n=1 Tax=Burkholderia gladioli TaxID=28095 RepID=UPI001364DCC5|nr:hypothetical protein [Burkholderia gladioli]KAF1062771.1 hypothetical protein LvStA_01405 [Burkholderia gladioli]MDN7495091.1 hypothetical protein [Burkholderia gladioli]WAG19054.1 hypothetical protein DX980_07265 [Burkholderia gladioli]